MRVPFRHYLALTTVSTFFLILLGVYTGKIGAGLACDARWPLCDGWMGLFPANWPSFVEWFHRLVAMIVGFMILAAAIIAWRGDYSRYLTYATVGAAVILPLQIIFGANTVLVYGLLPGMLHHTAAQLIFGALVVATTLAYIEAGGGGDDEGGQPPSATTADD